MKKALTVLTLVLLLSVFGFTQNLAVVINALGARESTLTIFKQYAITDDLTIPANITLKFLQGGSVTITVAKTLTINGQVEAGPYQIFEGLGTVDFRQPIEVNIEWWGIDGTDDHLQLIQAIASLYQGTYQKGGKVRLQSDTYSFFDTDLTIPLMANNVHIEGRGQSTLININGNSVPFRFHDVVNVYLKHLQIRIKTGSGMTNPVLDIYVNADGEVSRYNTCEDIRIYDERAVDDRDAQGIRLHAECPGGDSVNISINTFRNIQLFFMAKAIHLEGAVSNNPYINGNRFDGVWIFQPEIGVEMSKFGAGHGCNNRNLFTNVKVQCGGWTTDGFKDITNNGNVFDDCLVWDYHLCTVPNFSWSLDAEASATRIKTTAIDFATVQDLGERTQFNIPGRLKTSSPTKLTVSGGGAITITGDYHLIDGDGDANDDLDTINGFVDGMILILQAEDDAVTITIRDNSVGGGNIETKENASIILDDVEDKAYIFYDATNSTWTEIGRTNFGLVTKKMYLSNATFTKGGTAPTQVILGNLNGWEFDIGDDAVMTRMIQPDWAVGTLLTIKICWYIDEAYVADKEIQWRVDWSALPHDFSETVDAPTHSGQIDSGVINIPAVAKRMGTSTIGIIAGASLSAGDMLGFTLSRIAVAGDDPTAKPTAHHLIIEYTSDKMGAEI